MKKPLFLFGTMLTGAAAWWYKNNHLDHPRTLPGVELPDTMQALVLHDYDFKSDSLRLEEKPLPSPGPGEVLIRVEATPINPSDLMFIQGKYGFKKPTPTIPGFEGMGQVVATGGGALGHALLGRRVACGFQSEADGLWAEYVVAPAQNCLPLAPHISRTQGATMLVNPLTAYAMIDVAQRQGHQAIVHTAAASSLGRILLQLGQHQDLPIIHIVRRAEQAEYLRQLGAEHVIDSSRPVFEAELEYKCRDLNATLAFDAVGGELTTTLFEKMPPGSTIMVYGNLSETAVSNLDPLQLIFKNKRVQGFWLTEWINQGGWLTIGLAGASLQRLMAHGLETQVQAELPLSQFKQALETYMNDMTGGKVLFIP